MKKLIIVLLGVLLLLPASTSAAELFTKDLRYGQVRNADVKRLQEYLHEQGLYSGAITGNFYTLTQRAVRALQKRENLKITGKFDIMTRERVNESFIATEAPLIDYTYTPEPQLVTDPTPLPTLTPIQPIITPQPTVINDPIPYTPPVVVSPQPTTPPPIPTTPTIMPDIIPPIVTFTGWTDFLPAEGSKIITWDMGRPSGNRNDLAGNALVIRTDEPTNITVEYIKYFAGFDYTQPYAGMFSSWTDGVTQDTHIMILKGLLDPYPDQYLFRFSVKDVAMNEYKTVFRGSDNTTLYWSIGHRMNYDNTQPAFTELNNVRTTY